jgi:phosphoribosylglycinamide formyltransferase-1
LQNNLKKIKTAIFISGRGSNMESLIKATKNREFPASILVVITNNALASGIHLAKNYNIPVKIFDKKNLTKSSLKSTLKKYCQI